MDFVAKEIFYLFWFSSMLGTIGGTVTGSDNQVVLDGTRDVTITCASTKTTGNLIKWSFTTGTAKGTEKIIKNGESFKDTKTYSGLANGNSYTLTTTASASTAGKYTCDDTNGIYSVLLIVFKHTCDYFPKPTNTRPCDSNLTLSCDVEYFVDPIYVIPHLTWLDGQQAPVGEATSSSPSTRNVTWPTGGGDMQIYTCEITLDVKNLPSAMNQKAPVFSNTCQPFNSANDVPCGQKEDPSGKGDPNSTDDPEKSGQNNFSVRSAETNNLAIRVLGVAGVLLLAQVL